MSTGCVGVSLDSVCGIALGAALTILFAGTYCNEVRICLRSLFDGSHWLPLFQIAVCAPCMTMLGVGMYMWSAVGASCIASFVEPSFPPFISVKAQSVALAAALGTGPHG